MPPLCLMMPKFRHSRALLAGIQRLCFLNRRFPRLTRGRTFFCFAKRK